MNEQIKDTIQDCNLNFLIGSGLSRPFLTTLGTIEDLLTQLEAANLPADKAALIKASLYKKYFDDVISKNLDILSASPAADPVLHNYTVFLENINAILLRRKSTILSKEVNLFTTNIDIFLEQGLETVSLEFNDGFNGRFKPSFSLSNFKKSRFKKSLHYDNTAEIPVFNLLKLHGSLSWRLDLEDKIGFCLDLAEVQTILDNPVSPQHILPVPDNVTLAVLAATADHVAADATTANFMELYERLPIVNPTKEKFKHTLINQVYYELLRIYANELEKENTVLFVLGFSFADEHIRDITLRAANSNPTLMIYVIAYDSVAKAAIRARFGPHNIKNRNIVFMAPPQQDNEGVMVDQFKYDFPNINARIFGSLFKEQAAVAPPANAPGA